MNPSVDMNPSTKYRACTIYNTPFTGKLTDARIAHYSRLGLYGSDAKRAQEIRDKLAKEHRIARLTQATRPSSPSTIARNLALKYGL